MEGRHGDAILLDVDAVLEGMRGSDLAKAKLGSHGGGGSRGPGRGREVTGDLDGALGGNRDG